MTQQQLATARILLPYTVDGFQHKMHAYVRGLTLQGSDYYINSRTLDENDVQWHFAADRLGAALVSILGTGDTFGTMLLQKLDGIVWDTVDSYVPSVTGPTGTHVVASQLVYTLRDKKVNLVKIVVMEPSQAYPQRLTFATAGNAAMDGFLVPFTTTVGNAYDPYAWLVSKSNQYLSNAPFVSAVVGLNRKMKRRRGVG